MLGEEAMAAEVEAEAVALLGAGEAADERLSLENGHAATALREVQRGGQAGRAGPQDKDILTRQRAKSLSVCLRSPRGGLRDHAAAPARGELAPRRRGH